MSLQGQYRTTLYDQWVKQLTIHHVPHTSKPTLIATLGNPVKIRSWQVTIRRWQGVLPAGGAWSLLPPSHSPFPSPARGRLLPALLGTARRGW